MTTATLGATTTDTITVENTVTDETTTKPEPTTVDEATPTAQHTSAKESSSSPTPTAMRQYSTRQLSPFTENSLTEGTKICLLILESVLNSMKNSVQNFFCSK